MSHMDRLFAGWRRTLDAPEPAISMDTADPPPVERAILHDAVSEPEGRPPMALGGSQPMGLPGAMEMVATASLDFEECEDQALTLTPPVLPQAPDARLHGSG
jgi:hypothetical protein